jgi:hypothetical protein
MNMSAMISSLFVGFVIALAAFMLGDVNTLLILAISGCLAFVANNEAIYLPIRLGAYYGGMAFALLCIYRLLNLQGII